MTSIVVGGNYIPLTKESIDRFHYFIEYFKPTTDNFMLLPFLNKTENWGRKPDSLNCITPFKEKSILKFLKLWETSIRILGTLWEKVGNQKLHPILSSSLDNDDDTDPRFCGSYYSDDNYWDQ